MFALTKLTTALAVIACEATATQTDMSKAQQLHGLGEGVRLSLTRSFEQRERTHEEHMTMR